MFDWNMLKSFTAVGEHGSISGAARASGVSQPTLSRHISLLEGQIGARLFERSVSGVNLTPRGTELMRHAKDMADAAARFSMSAEGVGETLSGSVRITASHIVATYLLPSILTRLRLAEPDITLEVVASDDTENLLRREADIAIRMYRPSQLDVITRKVGQMAIGMFMSQSYLKRRGMPQTLEDVLRHDVIGYDRDMQIIEGFKAAGLDVGRDFFAFRCDNQVVCWEMVLAGYGIGFNPVIIGAAEPSLVRVDIAGDVDQLPIWLTAHSELISSPRIRRIYDVLASQLSAIMAAS